MAAMGKKRRCIHCGEPVRPTRDSDGLPLYDWTHKGGGPICSIVLTAYPDR